MWHIVYRALEIERFYVWPRCVDYRSLLYNDDDGV